MKTPPLDYFIEEDLEEIFENTISMPILFTASGSAETVKEVISIVDLGEPGIMGVPENITLERILPNGIVTMANYVLVDSWKAHADKFQPMPENN